MHDESPESRHGESDDTAGPADTTGPVDTSTNAFDVLGLSELFDPTRENPVVGRSDPASRAGGADAYTRPPAFADTITSNPPTSAIFPWIAPKPGDTQRLEVAKVEAEQAEASRLSAENVRSARQAQQPEPGHRSLPSESGDVARGGASTALPASDGPEPVERRSLAGLARPFPTSAEELLSGSGSSGPVTPPPAASTLPGVALTAPIAEPADQAEVVTSPRAQARAERAARVEAEIVAGPSSLAGLAREVPARSATSVEPSVVVPPVEPRSASPSDGPASLATTPIGASEAAAFPWALSDDDVQDGHPVEEGFGSPSDASGATDATTRLSSGAERSAPEQPPARPTVPARTETEPTRAMFASAADVDTASEAPDGESATVASWMVPTMPISTVASGDDPTAVFPVAAAGVAVGATAGRRAAASGGGDRSDGSRGRSGGSGGAGGSGGGGPVGGVLGSIRQHPRAWLIAAIVVGAVVLGAISFGLGAASASASSGVPVGTASPRTTATPTPKPTVRATPSAAPAAATVRTCTVDQYASDPGFGTLEAQVRNATTGQVLYDRNGGDPQPTASVLKTLTAAAALNVLGPNYQVPTTVVKGSQPGQVVIIGGGDVTLSRLPVGQSPYYYDPPHLVTLAQQVEQAWNADPSNNGQPITSLVVDTSLYSGPVWLPSWDEHEERVVEGSTPYIVPLMVDGDKEDPTALESPRSTTPVQNAAQDFAADLGGDISITYNGTAPAGAKQLGQVLSQPVSELIEQALRDSDNTTMEMLARLVAIKDGAGNTFAAENQGTLTGLQYLGIPETGLYFADGSGLSGDDRVPASYLTQFMVKVLNRVDNLGIIYDGLPIAGQTGTLGPGYDRFDGDFSSQADGQVNAKTGWINQARTLSGIIHAKDGTPLTFAVFALNYADDDAALNAIDNLTTAFYLCGNNLSDN